MRSARLPGSTEPMSASAPRARAPSRVAIQTASRAGSAPGPRRTDWRMAARRISSNMSRRLLQAAPSAPSDTEMPRRRSSVIGRDAAAELQVGARAVEHLDAAATPGCPARARQPRRSAPRTAAPRPCRSPRSTRCCASRSGARRWRSPPAAPRRACARGCPALDDSAPTSSSRSREHDTANRGANAARMRPPAAPSHRR